MCVCSERDAESSSQTEVSQFQITGLVDEQVLGLEISVKDTVGVAVVNSSEQLEGEFL